MSNPELYDGRMIDTLPYQFDDYYTIMGLAKADDGDLKCWMVRNETGSGQWVKIRELRYWHWMEKEMKT